MKNDADYDGLFDAFRDAGAAFSRLGEKGLDMSDQDLARDRDYLQLHHSGMRIALIGGEDAIRGAIRSICDVDAPRPNQARCALERLWAGMGTWTH